MISFAITTHNEGAYLQNLFDQLIPYCEQSGDEIVVLDDYSNDDYTRALLDGYFMDNTIQLHHRNLNDHFANHKNYLNQQCNGDYIFQIDADETLHPTLLKYLPDIVYNNTAVELFLIPRINIVNGLTSEDIQRWGWRVNEKGWVMFPDYQTRLYKNDPHIQWQGQVHERIVGHKSQAELPAEEQWSIIHEKEIQRQREQNAYYDKLS